MTKNVNLILKIIMWTILLHVILIALTVLEVFIYSTVFNSGQDNSVYENHAQKSGPLIAIILGFVLVYVVAARLSKANKDNIKLICIGLPIGYILLDVIIIVLSSTSFVNNFWTFGISYITKILAGFLASRATPKPTK
jgi:hypothetical protein